jgi:UDP-N-acetyl-D-mannosaminuronic acid transferase (WecB/TagA/CpsF family)
MTVALLLVRIAIVAQISQQVQFIAAQGHPMIMLKALQGNPTEGASMEGRDSIAQLLRHASDLTIPTLGQGHHQLPAKRNL